MRGLQVLHKYCVTWTLNLILDKSKIIKFNESEKLFYNAVKFDHQPIEGVESYKHLGMIFSVFGTLTNQRKH